MSSKTLKCNKGCGTTIHFDDRHLSQSGKKIPLEESGEPHQCPNSDYSKGRGSGRSSYQDSSTDGFDIINGKLNEILSILKGQSTFNGNE